MDEGNELRNQLVALLDGGNAHMTFKEALHDFPMDHINTKFPNGTYSPWALLEHIRFTQWDILDFIINPHYLEKEWPKEYWPAPNNQATEQDWFKTMNRFYADLDYLKKIVSDPKTDVFAKVAAGNGQTILREILLVADHNAYHLGEFAIMRQTMNTWKDRT